MVLFSRELTVVFLALGLCHAPLLPAAAQGISPDSNNASGPSTAAFLANPSSLLTAYPLGGGALVSSVRNLVVSDLQTLSTLLTLAISATDDQKNAIGTGIGLAALMLLPSNPQAASLIQSGVVGFHDPICWRLLRPSRVTSILQQRGRGPAAGRLAPQRLQPLPAQEAVVALPVIRSSSQTLLPGISPMFLLFRHSRFPGQLILPVLPQRSAVP